MASVTLNALSIPGFPGAVRFRVDRLSSHVTGRVAAIRQAINGRQDDPDPLDRRGFRDTAVAIKEYRNWLTCAARWTEGKNLPLDVLFAFAYGGGLAMSLWWVWGSLGHPFHAAWIAAPLAILLASDWIEHLVQVAHLRHSVSSPGGRSTYLWMTTSSFATIIKLWLTFGLCVSLAGLVVKLLPLHSHPRLLAETAHRLAFRCPIPTGGHNGNH